MNNNSEKYTLEDIIRGEANALNKRNLSRDEALKELVIKNTEIEVQKGLIGSIEGYANQLETNIETLNEFISVLKTEYENANNRNKEIDAAFSNYVRVQEKLRVIQEKHHKNLGRMEQKKAFASEGGKTRAANSPAAKALKEIEGEFYKEHSQFKRHGYGAEFCRRMYDIHYPNILDIKSIQDLVTRLKRKQIPSN